MDTATLLTQVLNGLQYGLLLFLVASGLTLVFGIMGIINLAHGSLTMVGAYLAYAVGAATGSLWLALPVAVVAGALFGALLERVLFRRFYARAHLDQVLLTFALILLFEEGRSLLLGNDFHAVPVPPALDWSVPISSVFSYSVYRLFVLAVCVVIAAALFVVIHRTRFGGMIRASAEKPEMVEALGIRVSRVQMAVFALGTALAMLAGALSAPLTSVYPNMGDGVLIVSFVVVVIGGIGSIAGAFWGALLIGLVDTLGKALLPDLAGIAVYVLMAAVLLWRPTGLFARAA